jgi:hypothetical protein
VLSDVPAMPELVLQLAVPVAPRIPPAVAESLRPPSPLREHRFGIGDVKGQHHGRAANRGWASAQISGNSSARCSRPSAIRG